VKAALNKFSSKLAAIFPFNVTVAMRQVIFEVAHILVLAQSFCQLTSALSHAIFKVTLVLGGSLLAAIVACVGDLTLAVGLTILVEFAHV